MDLFIGGYAQGKLDYVLQLYQDSEAAVVTEDTETAEHTGKRMIFNHFHLWVKEQLEEGNSPEERLEVFLKKYPDCAIISDEVGNGIVPVEPEEREYRERLGRMLILLAKRAERVERVICGIGQRIK